MDSISIPQNKMYRGMIRDRNAIFFHSICHIERTVSGPNLSHRNGGRATIRACIGHGNNRVLGSQHIQQFWRNGVLMTTVRQLHDGARQKRSCFAPQAAYLNVCYAIIKLYARPSHHEGQKTTDGVGWRRTIQGWVFYAAKSALLF